MFFLNDFKEFRKFKVEYSSYDVAWEHFNLVIVLLYNIIIELTCISDLLFSVLKFSS